jgi:hypothetical protein
MAVFIRPCNASKIWYSFGGQEQTFRFTAGIQPAEPRGSKREEKRLSPQRPAGSFTQSSKWPTFFSSLKQHISCRNFYTSLLDLSPVSRHKTLLAGRNANLSCAWHLNVPSPDVENNSNCKNGIYYDAFRIGLTISFYILIKILEESLGRCLQWYSKQSIWENDCIRLDGEFEFALLYSSTCNYSIVQFVSLSWGTEPT